MAYPKELNNQYKAEKAAGTTTATSFPKWMEMRSAPSSTALAVIEGEGIVKSVEGELMEKEVVGTALVPVNMPIVDVLAIVEQATEAVKQFKSSADHARHIFEEEYNKAGKTNPTRKTVVARFMAEVGLTKKGAATYIQNCKRAFGLITPKA